MTLTGKCKEDFDEWYKNPLRHKVALYRSIKYWETFPDSMQYGVYVDWFDSVDTRVIISNYWDYGEYFQVSVNDSIEVNEISTRQEARTAAIEKANEIYNER
jgi:hypothetical protein